jgi:hypothetical protein
MIGRNIIKATFILWKIKLQKRLNLGEIDAFPQDGKEILNRCLFLIPNSLIEEIEKNVKFFLLPPSLNNSRLRFVHDY